MSNNCSNCYNGCTEIISDKCVKYTGVDAPVLGIKNGDSLSYVEQSLITFLSSTLDGTGIIPVVLSTDICPALQSNLPECEPLSLNNYLTGLVKTLCTLQATVDELEVDVVIVEPYTLNCITASSNSDTKIVLQATINKLCAVNTQLNDFILFVDNMYVKVSDINTYIANYINSNPAQQLMSNRMVPFSAQPYFGTLNNFDASGSGIGLWANIFLCNGSNGTPDLRGRTVVGTTSGMGGGSLSIAVDPSFAGNPTYNLNSVVGTNSVILSPGQIPAHTHSNTAITNLSPSEHSHLMAGASSNAVTLTNQVPIIQSFSTGGNFGYGLYGTTNAATLGKTSNVTITATTLVTNQLTGGGLSHPNFQPAIGSYYIIYIP